MIDVPRLCDLPLREQKAARTRLSLMHALTERLATRVLDDVSVGELAAAAQISEATFFNYFPSKPHLLSFFVQVWSLEVAAVARRIEAQASSALSAIEAIFEHTAGETARNPKLMLETIAHQARQPAEPGWAPLDRGVRLMHLPDVENVLDLPDTGLEGVLPPLVAKAVAAGELPPRTPTPQIFLALTAVFFGVPLIFARKQPEAVGPMYRDQLQLIWAGARALGETA